MPRPRLFTLLVSAALPILCLTLYFHTQPVDRGFKNADLEGVRTLNFTVVDALEPRRFLPGPPKCFP